MTATLEGGEWSAAHLRIINTYGQSYGFRYVFITWDFASSAPHITLLIIRMTTFIWFTTSILTSAYSMHIHLAPN